MSPLRLALREIMQRASRAAGAHDYSTARAIQTELYRILEENSARLKVFPSGPMGLTPDDVKATPEWMLASDDYAQAFSTLRQFNQDYTRRFSREIRAERAQRRSPNAGAE